MAEILHGSTRSATRKKMTPKKKKQSYDSNKEKIRKVSVFLPSKYF